MKIAVRYQSRGGNTKAVAEMIANAFDVEALTVNNPIDKYTDIIFLGGGVYMNKMDKTLFKFIEQLSSDKVGKVVAFSTSGAMSSTLKQIKKMLETKGITVSQKELLIKMFLRGHSSLGLEGGKLTQNEKNKVQSFIENLQREV